MTTETPWLEVMRSRLGTQEVEGDGNNPVIVGWFKAVGHGEVRDDATAWCAITVGSALKECALPIPPRDVNMMARSFLSYGVKCDPAPGAIAIWPRGTGWQGHVNIVESVTPDGMVICIGGNQSGKKGGDAVTRTKPMDPSKALGFRMPVKPTVPALRKAGSTEIKKGDGVQNAGTAIIAIPGAIAAASEILKPITTPPKLENIGETLTFWQQTIGGVNAVGKLVLENPWLAGTCIVGLFLAWLGSTIKKNRVAKAEAGVPLSAEVSGA